jgi:hypothetical protein
LNLQTGLNHYIPVKEDSGTDVNWISNGLARNLSLQIDDAAPGLVFLDFSGTRFEAKQRVTLPLIGILDKSEHTECFIAPEGFPWDGIVIGNNFIKEIGPIHSFFAEKPEGPAFLMVQKGITVRLAFCSEPNVSLTTVGN